MAFGLQFLNGIDNQQSNTRGYFRDIARVSNGFDFVDGLAGNDILTDEEMMYSHIKRTANLFKNNPSLNAVVLDNKKRASFVGSTNAKIPSMSEMLDTVIGVL